MKFDYILGNPPYQDEVNGELRNFAPPMYNYMLDAAYELSDHVMMIHPARFLYNAGSTPKSWNKKMLSDPHLKVIWHEQDSSKVFPGTNIMGGVAVTYHDAHKDYGAIGTYTSSPELNEILHKVTCSSGYESLDDIVMTSYAYHFTDKLHEDYPEAASLMSVGHAYDLKSNVFTRLKMVFKDEKPDDGHEYIRIFGLDGNNRVFKYIRAEYVHELKNLYKWKVFVPQANGSPTLGSGVSTTVIGQPIIVEPAVAQTESFVSIGYFDAQDEAEACLKYIKGKFARTMVGILKVTQNGNKPVWKYVPLQDFTPSSDIDWSAPIPDIDQQLYRKYNLDPTEISFIESHVKPME